MMIMMMMMFTMTIKIVMPAIIRTSRVNENHYRFGTGLADHIRSSSISISHLHSPQKLSFLAKCANGGDTSVNEKHAHYSSIAWGHHRHHHRHHHGDDDDGHAWITSKSTSTRSSSSSGDGARNSPFIHKFGTSTHLTNCLSRLRGGTDLERHMIGGGGGGDTSGVRGCGDNGDAVVGDDNDGGGDNDGGAGNNIKDKDNTNLKNNCNNSKKRSRKQLAMTGGHGGNDDDDDGDGGGWDHDMGVDENTIATAEEKELDRLSAFGTRQQGRQTQTSYERGEEQMRSRQEQQQEEDEEYGHDDDDDDDDMYREDEEIEYFKPPPSQRGSVWVDKDEAIHIEGCKDGLVNGLYLPDEFAWGNWYRWKNSISGCYMWYSSSGNWHITEKDEVDAYEAGPNNCLIWYVARGIEWCPPKSGWFNRTKAEPDMILFKKTAKSHDTNETKVIGGVAYKRSDFIPQFLKSEF